MDVFQKTIEITKVALGINFEVKTTNILKGEEPEKTNKFLQYFYQAATSGKDFPKMINKFLEYKKKKEEEKKKSKEEGGEKEKGTADKKEVKKEAPQQVQSKPAEVKQPETKDKSKPANTTNTSNVTTAPTTEGKKNITHVRPQTPSKKPNALASDAKEIQETKKTNEKPPQGLISDKYKDEEENKKTSATNNPGSKNKPKDEDLGSSTQTGKIKIESRIGKFADITSTESTKAAVKSFTAADLESIKNYVQEISKNSNPIGKIIDFLGDDIESMNKELHSWMKDAKNYKDRYDEEVKYKLYI
jgi:hypothetical protein